MYTFCPNCESRNVIIYEEGEDDSTCLECAFTWRQYERHITVPRQVLKQLAGMRRHDRGPEETEEIEE